MTHTAASPSAAFYRSAARVTLIVALAAAACHVAGAADDTPSPAAGSSASKQANKAADSATYQSIDYANAAKKGPQIIVLAGQVKSANASFTTKVTPTNIADFAEIELGKANFGVLERSDLGPLTNEIETAYNLGDQEAVKKILQKGRLKSTRWVVKFDILKAEPVATVAKKASGGVIARLANILGTGKLTAAAGTAVESVSSGDEASVWIVGMRYKILDANTTEQVATNYFEEKLELGKSSGTALGVESEAAGGLTLDSLAQRLVQKSVREIDAKYK